MGGGGVGALPARYTRRRKPKERVSHLRYTFTEYHYRPYEALLCVSPVMPRASGRWGWYVPGFFVGLSVRKAGCGPGHHSC